jgi:phosphatidate cytidylyltransferase
VATAAVLIAVLLAALFLLPRAGFAGFVAAVLAAAAYEWARLCRLGRLAAAGYAAALAAAFGAAVLSEESAHPAWFAAAAVFWLLVAPAWLWRGVRPAHAAALAFAGFAVLLPPALSLVTLGPVLALLVLALVWIADITAYFVGMRFGRHRLAPDVSPGKTWEGAAGGLLGALAYAIICGVVAAGVAWIPYLAAAALLAAASILGDLFESAAKRQASVKDSGRLLPGHGGILDRIDSATSTLPLAALLAPWVLGR